MNFFCYTQSHWNHGEAASERTRGRGLFRLILLAMCSLNVLILLYNSFDRLAIEPKNYLIE